MKTNYSWREKKYEEDDYKYVQLFYNEEFLGEYLVEHINSQFLPQEIRIGGVSAKPIEGGESAAKVILMTQHLDKLERQLEHAVSFIVNMKNERLI
jgi:hypothetical protein